MPEQVQDFYPTPSTISTCMYYTGLDPRTMKKVYVRHTIRMKKPCSVPSYSTGIRKTMIWSYEALHHGSDRTDLIGFDNKMPDPAKT